MSPIQQHCITQPKACHEWLESKTSTARGYNINQINLRMYNLVPHHKQYSPAPSTQILAQRPVRHILLLSHPALQLVISLPVENSPMKDDAGASGVRP